jgi:hypothetical protein
MAALVRPIGLKANGFQPLGPGRRVLSVRNGLCVREDTLLRVSVVAELCWSTAAIGTPADHRLQPAFQRSARPLCFHTNRCSYDRLRPHLPLLTPCRLF